MAKRKPKQAEEIDPLTARLREITSTFTNWYDTRFLPLCAKFGYRPISHGRTVSFQNIFANSQDMVGSQHVRQIYEKKSREMHEEIVRALEEWKDE